MTTTATQPEPLKQGAQPGNDNAARHGLRGGSVPRPFKYCERQANAFRRAVESAVVADRGEVWVGDGTLISTAHRAELGAQIFMGMFKRGEDGKGRKLSTTELIGCVEKMVKCSESRDKAVKALKLSENRPNSDIWSVVHAIQLPTNGAQPPEDDSTAQERPTGLSERDDGPASTVNGHTPPDAAGGPTEALSHDEAEGAQ